MDPYSQPQHQSTENPQTVQATAPKHKKPVLMWIILVLLLAGTSAFATLYLSSQKQLKETQQLKTGVEQRLGATQLSLNQAQDRLKTAVFMPDKVSPQCNSNSNAQLKLAPVNATPIDGYNIYIVNCLNSLIAGKNDSKIIAFKVEADGSQTFKYGAGSGEPFCVSGKILPANVAADISSQTGLPVCKTF